MKRSLRFSDHGLVSLRFEAGWGGPVRVWSLEDGDPVLELPAGDAVLRVIDDGRLLVGDWINWGRPRLVDPVTREVVELYVGTGSSRLAEGGVDVLEGVTCCTVDPMGQAEGPLTRFTWDGARETLAERASWPYGELPDGRVLTTLDVGEDWLGGLYVVDRGSLDEQLVDDRVLTGLLSVGEDGDIVYGVVDGERTGVWLVRVAGAEALAPRGGAIR